MVDMTKAQNLYKFLKEDKSGIFAGGHDVLTPQLLVEEILSKVPGFNADKTVLVLFNIEFVISLVYTYGVNSKNITFYADHPTKVKMALRIGLSKDNIITDLENTMKFDVVVGNPPYQDTKETSYKLWNKFLVKANDMVNQNGFIGMIIPTTWTQPLSNKPSEINKAVNDIMFGNSILWSNLNVNSFFNVGINISAFVLKKDNINNIKKFLIVNDFKDMSAKILSVPNDKLFVNADSTIWKRLPTSSVKTSTFKNKIMGKKGIMFSDVQDDVLAKSPKVIIPRELGYFVLLDTEGCGFNNQSRAKICSSKNEAKSVYSFYSSNVVKFVMKTYSWVPQTDFNLLSMIKTPKFDKVFSNDDVYKHFNLTQEEIDYIESNVK
jgi:hypothetical protein